jgi:lysozyme family protein
MLQLRVAADNTFPWVARLTLPKKSGVAMAQYRFERLEGDYARLWAAMHVVKQADADKQARAIVAHKARYQAVEKTTGVPWFVVGCLHMRESGGRFDRWLHNGDPMRDRAGNPARTVQVPAGRPPDPNVTWEQGAFDALIVCEHFGEITTWSPARVAYAAERFNGFGYRAPARNIPSPYLWGGTSVQKPGKFVRDGKYDPRTVDPQIGVMAVLKALMALDPEAAFATSPIPPSGEVEAAPDDAPVPLPPDPPPAPLSPRADDTETQAPSLKGSRTIWGGLTSFVTTIGSAFVGFADKLHDPYILAGFLGLLGAGSIGLYLVVTGRLNVQKLVAHLSDDDTEAA